MKTLLIYKSVAHGNTEKVARAISEVLQARMLTPGGVSIDDIEESDLIGFGSGIYRGKHHQKLLALVDELPEMSGKRAFIFSTSGTRNRIGQLPPGLDFNRSLRKRLIARGFEVVDDFSCRGYDDWGPIKLVGGIGKDRPNAQDLEDARKFALRLRKSCLEPSMA